MARIKGTSLIKMLKVLQKSPAVAERVIPPELQHYFEDRVLSSAWYPEEHYTGYLHRFVELCGAHEISVQLVRMQSPKQGPTEWLVRFAAS